MSGKPVTWRVLERRLVYENPPWIAFSNEDVLLPDGRRVNSYHVVELRPHAIVFAITADRQVLAIRSYRRAMDALDVSLPAGALEGNEEPVVAAQRELLEETGYAADRWTPLGSFAVDGNYGCGRAHVFLAEGAKAVRADAGGDLEELEVLHLPLTDVMAGTALHDVGTLSAAAAVGLATAALLRRERP